MTNESNATQGGAEVGLDHVRFAYGDFAVQFDATVASGSITAVMGPSGSGKSTLLSLVAGFERPSAGRILIGGADVTSAPPHERLVSMVFQENNLFAHLNVAANVGLGISPGLKLTADDQDSISEALEKTGLAGKENRLPNELSGGERQRVALARVLVRKRPVLLLDEPFASLGPALRHEMLDLVATLHREQRMTILFVTHHPDDARRLAQNTLFLEDGAIVAAGEPSIVFGDHGPDAIKRYIGRDFGKSA